MLVVRREHTTLQHCSSSSSSSSIRIDPTHSGAASSFSLSIDYMAPPPTGRASDEEHRVEVTAKEGFASRGGVGNFNRMMT